MRIPVLVEPKDGGGYVARVMPPVDWSAEGKTVDEAIRQLEIQTAERQAAGAQVHSIEVRADNPILRYAGCLPDDEITQEWLDIIERNRREMDADPDR